MPHSFRSAQCLLLPLVDDACSLLCFHVPILCLQSVLKTVHLAVSIERSRCLDPIAIDTETGCSFMDHGNNQI